MSGPTNLELLLGRIVVKETYPERGWIGVVQADVLGRQNVTFLSRRHELYLVLAEAMKIYGPENMRQMVNRHAGNKSEIIFHIPLEEAKTRMRAKAIITARLGSE
jgi:hypothetical protein